MTGSSLSSHVRVCVRAHVCKKAKVVIPVIPVTEQMADLADRVARLAPAHRDPERFHIDKSEIVAELRALAKGRDHG